MDGLLLDRLDLERLELLVKHLAQIHDNAGAGAPPGDGAARGHSAAASDRRPRGQAAGAAAHLSWIFCHKCARKIWMSEILSVGILPCMKMPVRSSCTWKPT